MSTQELSAQNEIFAAMANGKPLKSYKKVVLGQLLLKVWDSMSGIADEKVFSGDPRKGEDTVFDVFSEKEKVYFERMNKAHFASGSLIEYTRQETKETPVKRFEQFTDEELGVIVNSKFFSLQDKLNKIESTAVLFRMKDLANEFEKSEKIIRAIDARISELQNKEFAPKKPTDLVEQTEE